MTTGRGSAVATIGAPVTSADGKRLGVVKETRADRFLVDVRWAPDYWLGNEIIDNSSEELVQLLITREGIGPAKLHDTVNGPGISSDAEDIGGLSPQNRPPPTL
jgi:hypothetical protein